MNAYALASRLLCSIYIYILGPIKKKYIYEQSFCSNYNLVNAIINQNIMIVKLEQQCDYLNQF